MRAGDVPDGGDHDRDRQTVGESGAEQARAGLPSRAKVLICADRTRRDENDWLKYWNSGEQMNETEIFKKLIPLVQEITGAKQDNIKMESNLMEDLGAESIDLLDLSFLIEETFGVTIEADEFERQASKYIPGGRYEQDGFLTAEAIEQLKKALPEVPPEKLRPGLKKIEVPSVLNVAVFVHIIQRKLSEKQQEVTDA